MTGHPLDPAPAPILPDVWQPGIRLVFCGTAAGARSARERAYYAHPGNRFWPTLHEVGLTPRRLQPQEFPLLPTFGIGLTDVAKHHAGNDNQLPPGAFDAQGLRAKVLRWQPRWLAFTSKAAARAALGDDAGYGLCRQRIGNTQLFVLPSPSGQARGHWNVELWRMLAALARRDE
ncbi:mismatch-specific DNA-glycosylase [Dyella sp.]|uniref:mismatch-specific DNA-glycosylase n=1 Tax=Dyella sp. TaxID=1869338 RepID=UPI002ED0D571